MRSNTLQALLEMRYHRKFSQCGVQCWVRCYKLSYLTNARQIIVLIKSNHVQNIIFSVNLLIGTEPHACIEIATLFSWSTLLVAQITDMCSLWWQIPNLAAILLLIDQPRHVALVYSVHLWYWRFMLWLIDTCQNNLWPCCRLRFRVYRSHMCFFFKLTTAQILIFTTILQNAK